VTAAPWSSTLPIGPGHGAALAAALCWATATFLYRDFACRLPSAHLNLLKGIVAAALLAATLLFVGPSAAGLDGSRCVLLALSGLVGIAVGDSAYFAALARLGPRKALLAESAAPPLTALLALVALGERLSSTAWFGVVLAAAGVTWVVAERPVPPRDEQSAPPTAHSGADTTAGAAYGFVAALSQAAGAVMARAALVGASVSPLWAAFIRLAAATVGLSFWVFAIRSCRPADVTAGLTPACRRRLGLTIVIGTYLAIWLQQVALQHTSAGVAQTLLATSPLAGLVLARLGGERPSWRAVAGAFVAVAGVALLVGGPP